MLIYDRECGSGTRTATWIEARLRVPLTVVAWQELSDLDTLGLSESEVAGETFWVDAFGRIERGPRAIGRALTMASGPLVIAGWVLLVPPVRWMGRIAQRLRLL